MSNNTTKSDNDNSNSMIVPLPNGPLYLINNREPKVVENLVNSKDEKLSNIQGIAYADVELLTTSLFAMEVIQL